MNCRISWPPEATEGDREYYGEKRFVKVCKGLKPVAKKTRITLRIDTDVLEWYKSQGEKTTNKY